MMRNRRNCRNAIFAVFNMTALSIVPPNPSYTRIYPRDWASRRGSDFKGAIQRTTPIGDKPYYLADLDYNNFFLLPVT